MSNYTYFITIPEEYDIYNLVDILEYIKNNYLYIYQKLKFGDFIENGNESGYRSNGIYIIDLDDNENIKLSLLSSEPDDYGTIPLKFEGFTFFEPGFQFETIRDERCVSYFHNNLSPVNLLFLLKQKWLNNIYFKNYCQFDYNNKKFIVISNYSLIYLLSLPNSIIYGKIFTNNKQNYGEWNNDIYIYDIDIEKEKEKFLIQYDKILII